MGRVADILKSPEWADKSALEKAQAQRDLFLISMEDNPEWRAAFEGAADDTGKQAVVDKWKDQVRTAFPDAFTTAGFKIELSPDGARSATEARVPVYDVLTEQVLARVAPLKSRKSYGEWADDVKVMQEADLPDDARRALTPFIYERYGAADMSDADGNPLFAKPEDFIQKPSTGKAILQFTVPAAFRLAPPLAASVTRNPRMVALAAGAGDAAAQSIEISMGTRQSFSPLEVGLNSAFSLIPAAKIGNLSNPALNMAARGAIRSAEGAAQGAAFETIRQAVDEDEMDGARIGTTALFGAGLGAIIGGLEPKLAARLAGKSAAEALEIARKEPELANLARQIEESLGIGQPAKDAAESAASLAAENPPVLKPAKESADALLAAEAERTRLADQFAAARAEEAAQSLKDRHLAGDESVVLGDDPAKNTITAAQTRPGESAKEVAKAQAQLDAAAPKVDDGTIPETVKLSPQAQRMADEFGRVNPAFLAPVAGGAGGAAYGFTQGDTPEERAVNALKFGLLGLGAGMGVSAGINSGGGRRPTAGQSPAGQILANAPKSPATSKYRTYLEGLAKGTDGMPEWYLNFRTASPIIRLRETIYNARARVKDMVTQTPGDVPESANPYLAGKLFPGRVSARVKIEAEDAVQAAVWNRDKAADTWAKATGGDVGAFNARLNEFMVAKTARDYNREHSAFTIETGKPAAGMSDADAAAVIQRARAEGVHDLFEDLRQQVRAIDETVLDVMEDGQLISSAQAAALRKKYPEHVPLNRILEDDPTEGLAGSIFGTPRFGTKASGVKTGYGSDLAIDDIYGSVLTNLKEAIIRAEKNKVGLATVDFFRRYPVANARVTYPKVIGQSGDRPIFDQPNDNLTLVAREATDPAKPARQVWVEFDSPELAKAFNGLNHDRITGLYALISRGTRLLSGLYTRFNLGFIPSNKIRDLQEAATVALSSGDLKAAAQVPASVVQDTAAVASALLGRDTPGARLYNQALLDGAFTGGLASSTRQSSEKTIAQMGRRGPVRKTADLVRNAFDFLNGVAEDSTRLTAYRIAKREGTSDALAALSGREIGPDFNMKGTATAQASSLYAFINPGIQGGIRAGKAVIRNPKTAAAVTSAFVASAVLVDRWNSAIDPEWKRRKSMQFHRSNSIPIILGDDAEGYFVLTIPVAQMLRPVKALADVGVDVASGETIDAADAGKRVVQIAVDSLNPIGGQNARQAVTPTVLDPLGDIWANESFTGSPISPMARPGEPEYARIYSRTADTGAGQAALSAARTLDKIGVEVSPESLLYLSRGYGGGVTDLAMQGASLAAASQGGELTPRDLPIISRFVRYVRKDSAQADPAAERIMAQEGAASADNRLSAEARARQIIRDAPTMDDATKAAVRAEAEANPLLIQAIERELARGERSEMTSMERSAAALPVADGTRARFVYRYLLTLPLAERPAAYARFKEAKIVTDAVEEQVITLANSGM